MRETNYSHYNKCCIIGIILARIFSFELVFTHGKKVWFHGAILLMNSGARILDYFTFNLKRFILIPQKKKHVEDN